LTVTTSPAELEAAAKRAAVLGAPASYVSALYTEAAANAGDIAFTRAVADQAAAYARLAAQWAGSSAMTSPMGPITWTVAGWGAFTNGSGLVQRMASRFSAAGAGAMSGGAVQWWKTPASAMAGAGALSGGSTQRWRVPNSAMAGAGAFAGNGVRP
jgi:hypothetical protein